MAADEFTLTRAESSVCCRPARSGKSLARTGDRAGSFAAKEIRALHRLSSNEAFRGDEEAAFAALCITGGTEQDSLQAGRTGVEGQIGGGYGILMHTCA
jgi:hypothetical protein